MNFPDQVRWLKELGQRLGYDVDSARWYEAVANDAGINPETMRKWVGGFQPMPDSRRKTLELVEESRRRQAKDKEPTGQQIAEAYGFMSWQALLEAFANLAQGMKTATLERQMNYLPHLEGMLSQIKEGLLSGRATLTPPAEMTRQAEQKHSTSSVEPSSVESAARKAVDDVKHPGVIFGRKRKAG